VPDAIERLLRSYRATREPGENLRRFFARHSNDELRQFLAGQQLDPVERDQPAALAPNAVEG
jgi:sulfite reductase (ferredoxin)